MREEFCLLQHVNGFEANLFQGRGMLEMGIELANMSVDLLFRQAEDNARDPHHRLE